MDAIVDEHGAGDDRVNILLVDDRPEQRLSLAAVLADLGENIVQATSGREALRCLLYQEFALILLDVNMPGMDGFETAALIRQRRTCERTPIIFVTAYSDETHAFRGYSLGAVDYILSPVQPDVLRTKAAVFVDLFRKTRQVTRQAEALRQRALQLHRLTEASLAINSSPSVEHVLQLVTDTAANIVGVHIALTLRGMPNTAARHALMLSDKYAQLCPPGSAASLWLHPSVQGISQPLRRTRAELAADPLSPPLPIDASGTAPWGGLLAAPLAGRGGRVFGTVQLSDKYEGDFTADDEMILVQLAQMASIAIENIEYSEARESNRLKDEFLATLSHELRTPLQAMLSWTKLLRTGNLDGQTSGRALEVIERSAKAQAQLIDDLLDVSRIMSGKLRLDRRPVELGAIIEAATDAARPAAVAKEMEIAIALREPATVSGDPARLQQIIGNLLSNAIKFTPKRGRVDLSLDRVGANARIQVTDNGIGIAADFIPHLFERFRQADSSTMRAHGGLGLGLAIVRHLVDVHGGSVHAESPGEGCGATFTVLLPLVASPAVRVSPETPLEIAGANGNGALRLDGVRIVLVDDESDTRECLRMALQTCGASVSTFASVSEALAALDDVHPDVILSDVGMPGEDGYSLIRKVRAREARGAARVPAAALTAYVRPEDRLRALQAGFDLHVDKPIDPAQLAAVVKRLVARPSAA